MRSESESDRLVWFPGCRVCSGFHLLDDVGGADGVRQHGVMHRIDVAAGGAGLNPGSAASRSGRALVPVEAVAGRARLDPWRTVRVGDGPSSFLRENWQKP